MKKIYLSIAGFAMLCRLNAHAQIRRDSTNNKSVFTFHEPNEPDTDSYKSRQLKLDEVNLVSSYYWQDGNHSPVTGGIGTEKVTDIANGLDLKLVWRNQNLNKNSLSVGFGFDHHSSASAAYVSKTGASKTGGSRIYPSVDWTIENEKKGSSFGIGTYYSGEYNYQSMGADLHFSQKTHDKNGEFTIKVQDYFDHVKLIYPSEFIPQPTVIASGGVTIITTASGNRTLSSGGSSRQSEKAGIPSSPRNTLTASLSYSQMINARLQVMLMGDVVTQNGYLGLPFHRVYFSNGKDTIEKVPSTRFKLPIGLRLSYFMGDNIIIRSYYRYYTDDWGIRSNTIGLEIPVKLTPFFSVSPFYRYYDQTAAKYFAPYEVHNPNDQFYTSNYAYSQFKSGFYGVGLRIAPPTGVLGWQNFHDLEIRYGHYTQTTGLVSDVISFNLGFK